jgi:hypothetical protein
MRFEQPLTLNVSSDTSRIFEQSIEIGSGHSDRPTQVRGPQSRSPQVPADRLPHPLLTAHIDLPSGDGDPLGRWGDRRCDHRANRGRKAGDIGLRHDRQSSLEGHRARADARDRVGTADDAPRQAPCQPRLILELAASMASICWRRSCNRKRWCWVSRPRGALRNYSGGALTRRSPARPVCRARFHRRSRFRPFAVRSDK